MYAIFVCSSDHNAAVQPVLLGGGADPDLHHHQYNRQLPRDGHSHEAHKCVYFFLFDSNAFMLNNDSTRCAFPWFHLERAAQKEYPPNTHL